MTTTLIYTRLSITSSRFCKIHSRCCVGIKVLKTPTSNAPLHPSRHYHLLPQSLRRIQASARHTQQPKNSPTSVYQTRVCCKSFGRCGSGPGVAAVAGWTWHRRRRVVYKGGGRERCTFPARYNRLMQLTPPTASLSTDVAVFLERCGSKLTLEELDHFDVLRDDYEIN